MSEFLGTYNLPTESRRNRKSEKTDSTNEIKSVIKNSQQTKAIDQMTTEKNFTKHLNRS